MPTIQQLLTTVNTTYRNTYSTDQKIEWMDTTQRQIYQAVPMESIPFVFQTVADFSFYPLPDDCDRFGIKQVTIEKTAGTEKYETLEYISLESNQQLGTGSHFYSELDGEIFLNPLPTTEDEGKNVVIIYNHRPAELSTLDLTTVPDLPEDFQELLVLGCLERIARARGEIEDKNNFAADYEMLFRRYEKQYKLRQPEYYKPKDTMPRKRRGSWYGSRANRGNTVSDLIPPGLM